MKITVLLASILLAGPAIAFDEQASLKSIATRTSHWTLAGNDEPETEPLYDFPISNALGIRIDYEIKQQEEPRRIFSFYIATAR